MSLNKENMDYMYPMLTLKNLTKLSKERKRVGRGVASGLGKTCGRGYNGALSRTGSSRKQNGGQTPVYRRFPKTGFLSQKNKTQKAISAEALANHLNAFIISCEMDAHEAYKIDIQWLREMKIIKGRFDRFRVIMGKNNSCETEEEDMSCEENVCCDESSETQPAFSEDLLNRLKKTTIVASGFSKTARVFLENCGATLLQDTSKARQKMNARKEFFADFC